MNQSVRFHWASDMLAVTRSRQGQSPVLRDCQWQKHVWRLPLTSQRGWPSEGCTIGLEMGPQSWCSIVANCLLTAWHLGRDKEKLRCGGTWQAGREGETKQASVCVCLPQWVCDLWRVKGFKSLQGVELEFSRRSWGCWGRSLGCLGGIMI